MIARVAATLAAAAIVVAFPAGAALPETLVPTTPWQVDYSAKKCSAVRVFGAENAAVTVLIDQFGPGDGFKLSLIGRRFGGRSESSTKLRLRFAPPEDWQDVDYFAGDLGKNNPALFSRGTLSLLPSLKSNVSSNDTEFAEPLISDAQRASIKSLDLKQYGKTLQLATGRLDRLFVALNKCTDDLVKSWGYDPAVMASLQKRPEPLSSPATWITSADYPTSSIYRGERAMVAVRLGVDEKGAVTACDIQQASRDGDFGALVCKVFTKRGKFAPALDSAGKPIAAYWRSAVTFVLP